MDAWGEYLEQTISGGRCRAYWQKGVMKYCHWKKIFSSFEKGESWPVALQPDLILFHVKHALQPQFIPSNLEWLATLLARYAYTPEKFRSLGKEIVKALEGQNPRKQVNRVFRRVENEIPDLISWLVEDNNPASLEVIKCVSVLKEIQSGKPPSTAFGMSSRRGPHAGISKTNEAVALYRYMRDIVKMQESNAQILKWASELSGVSVDEIKKYEAAPPITPMDRKTEAMLAACRLADNDTWEVAERHFDTEDLKEYC
jgi:hypothetical protein